MNPALFADCLQMIFFALGAARTVLYNGGMEGGFPL